MTSHIILGISAVIAGFAMASVLAFSAKMRWLRETTSPTVYEEILLRLGRIGGIIIFVFSCLVIFLILQRTRAEISVLVFAVGGLSIGIMLALITQWAGTTGYWRIVKRRWFDFFPPRDLYTIAEPDFVEEVTNLGAVGPQSIEEVPSKRYATPIPREEVRLPPFDGVVVVFA